MPSEGLRTHRFKKALEAASSDLVWIKHSDRFTIGIPDSSITINHTVWLEFKNRSRRVNTTFSELLRATNRKARIQMYFLWRLGRRSGRAFYVVFEPDNKGVSLVRVVNPLREEFEHVVTDSQAVIVNTLLKLCTDL